MFYTYIYLHKVLLHKLLENGYLIALIKYLPNPYKADIQELGSLPDSPVFA